MKIMEAMAFITRNVFRKELFDVIIVKAILCRSVSTSSVLSTKNWRVKRGLPVNPNAEGPLTDAPDYTFLDGRPTPLLQKQKIRMIKQRHFAAKIVELCGELDFAVEREKKMIQAKEEEKENILRNRLKAKGEKLKRS